MKKQFLFVMFSLFCLSLLNAQRSNGSIDDPAAKKVLNKVKAKYDAESRKGGLVGSFKLTIKNPGGTEIQSGAVKQKGEMYHVKSGDNTIISDGKTIWLYNKKENHVQISNVDPDDQSVMTPSQMLKIYEREKEFTYGLLNTEKVPSGQDRVRFTPKDRYSDYAFFDVYIAGSAIKKVVVRGKDGTTYTLQLTSLKGKSLSAGIFRFDEAQYPGVQKTDTRI